MATKDPAHKLNPAERTFALTYLANGFNATAAYRAAHPKASDATARAEGYKYLVKPHIKAFIDKRLTNRWKALQMDGDEVLARLAMDARADIRLAFDAEGVMLPVSEWPDDLANSVNAVSISPDGAAKIALVSKFAARRTIAEVTKKLKGPGAGARTLARILAGDFEEDDDE